MARRSHNRAPKGVRPAVWLLAATLAPATALVGAGSNPSVDAWRNGPGIANHPVGIRPPAGMRIPDGWPLDPDGTLTCSTCHLALPALASSEGPLLREFDGGLLDSSEFCIRCHGGGGVTGGAAGMHWQAVARAHIRVDSAAGADAGGGLDLESRRCLECHDGVTASEGSAGRSRLDDPAWNHPVGVVYRPADEGGDTLLRPLRQLPATVRMPGGVVSCVSCHNLYASDAKLLSVPLQGSTLCFTCHQMEP